MNDRNFFDLVRARWQENKFVCLGLDSELSLVERCGALAKIGGEDARLAFNKAIVDATADIVCAYKPNPAFYEAQGAAGIASLKATVEYIRQAAPHVPILLDAKRGDIGNTNRGYATFAFDHLHADAVTVQPYLGKEAILPFLERKNKGIFVLARTSNPGAGEFQDALVDGAPLYALVARRVAENWNDYGNCGLVAGATYPAELAEMRSIAPDIPFLIPGIGPQGGGVEATVVAGQDSRGQGMLINSSRGIIFASMGTDFAEAARAAALRLHDEIVAAL